MYPTILASDTRRVLNRSQTLNANNAHQFNANIAEMSALTTAHCQGLAT